MPDLPLLSKMVDKKHGNEYDKCGLPIPIEGIFRYYNPFPSDCKQNAFSERLSEFNIFDV